MKKIIFALLLISFPVMSFAAGGHNLHLDEANVDLHDTASMQRGFKYFVNYCMGCHSAGYSRYNRAARDLGINDDILKENLIFATDEKGEQVKIGSLMKTAMTVDYAKTAFGTAPPDLSLTARSRGADWIYTYMRSFYLDPSRPFGVNNTVFPDVGMPHVMADLQGWQVKEAAAHSEGDHADEAPVLKVAKAGSMSAEEYDQAVTDLVNFMVYVSEPSKLARQQIGPWVLLYLAIFTALAYLLKKEYFKDVH